MRSRWELLGIVGIGLLAAVVGFAALLVGQHLWQDHETFHLMLGLTNYNLQQGKLVPMQPPMAPMPPPAVVPDRPPDGKPKP